MESMLQLGNSRTKIFAVMIFVASLVVNGLAGTTILGGNTTAEVSDSYSNLFTPAGATFVIWGLIYSLLTVFCIRLFIRQKYQTKEIGTLMARLTGYFIIASSLNALWLIAWQYRVLWLSVLLMVAILVTLIKASSLTFNRRLTNLDWVSLKLPFSIYFGWITVATIANVTAFLVSVGWNGWGISAEIWALIVLTVGAIIGIITALSKYDWAYLAVFVWAYFGIWLKHTSTTGYDNAYESVITLLVYLIPIFALLTLWLAYWWPKGVGRLHNTV
jgi:hypothetical protein